MIIPRGLKNEIDGIKRIAEILEHDPKEVIPEPVLITPELTSVFSTDSKCLSFIEKAKLKRNEQVILTVSAYGSKGATIEQ